MLSRARYDKFSEALNIWSGSDAGATEKQRDATNFLLNAPRQSGTLTIVDMKLGGLEKGMRAWFDSMKFNVNLCFPPSAPVPAAKNNANKSPAPNKIPELSRSSSRF